jgi:hypothetical protein
VLVKAVVLVKAGVPAKAVVATSRVNNAYNVHELFEFLSNDEFKFAESQSLWCATDVNHALCWQFLGF